MNLNRGGSFESKKSAFQNCLKRPRTTCRSRYPVKWNVAMRVPPGILVVVLLGIASFSFADPNVCASCGHYIGETVYLIMDRVEGEKKGVCETCAYLKRRCSLCGLPVKENYTALLDGRYLCARDAKTAVQDVEEAKRIWADASLEMDRLFSRSMTLPGTNIVFAVVDQVHMDQILQSPGFERQCPFLVGCTRSRLLGDGRWKHSIDVLSALPKAEMSAIGAHERTHAWLAENIAPERELDRDTIEGFCELVAYKLMEHLGETREMASIKRNAYSRGQIDLFVEAESTYGMYIVLQWLKHGVDGRLFDDLDRIRKVAEPRRSAVEIQPLPTTIAPTPVPDTLTLIGISGAGNRRLALINDRAFGANESGKVRVGKSNVVIHCLEIRVGSVIIKADGSQENQELFLKVK